MGRRKRAAQVTISPVRVSELPQGTEVLGPTPGDWRIATLPTGEKLVSPLQWGADRPDDVATAEDIRAACDVLDFPRGGTLAARAGAAFLWWVPGWREAMSAKKGRPTQEARSVPTAFREMWRNIHIGPMFSKRGRAAHAYHYDRRAAYLASLYEPLPRARTERRWRGPEAVRLIRAAADRAEDVHGVVYATLDTSWCGGPIGPLPVSVERTWTRGDGAELSQPCVEWPICGGVTGCWPIPLVLQAIQHGARLEVVYEAVVVNASPWLAPLGEQLEKHLMDVKSGSPAEKALKAVYQRSWLRTKPFTWAAGTVIDKHRVDTRPRQDDDAVWRQNGVPLAKCWLRPDVSWYVSLHNILAMTEAIYACPTVVAGHVDSLHTLSEHEGAFPDDDCPAGSFRLQKQGEAEFYGVGSYSYDGESKGAPPSASVSALLAVPDDAETHYTDRPAWSCYDPRFSGAGWLKQGETLEPTARGAR